MAAIKVKVFRPKRGPFYKVKWTDPRTQRQRQKSTKTKIQREADRFQEGMEQARTARIERVISGVYSIRRVLCRSLVAGVKRSKSFHSGSK